MQVCTLNTFHGPLYKVIQTIICQSSIITLSVYRVKFVSKILKLGCCYKCAGLNFTVNFVCIIHQIVWNCSASLYEGVSKSLWTNSVFHNWQMLHTLQIYSFSNYHPFATLHLCRLSFNISYNSWWSLAPPETRNSVPACDVSNIVDGATDQCPVFSIVSSGLYWRSAVIIDFFYKK